MPIGFPYTVSRNKTVGGKGTAANIPTQVSLAAWYRYHNGIVNLNGACSRWSDSSNNNRHLVQATAAARPTVLSDGSLLFDGTDDAMAVAFTLAQPFTVYLAFRPVTWTSGDIVFDGSTGTTKVTQTASTPQLTMDGGTALTADASIAVGNRGVIGCVFNGASSVYQAGGGAALVSTTGNAGANTAGGITLGSSRTGTNFANIQVFEMAVFSVAHDANTRLRLLRYIARVAQVGGV